jgi:site-specific DNA recombinase
VLSSLQLMQDYGVNLICVEDGIDSSKEAGKLLISIIAAVAEMERENIRVQTMAGREQKAREGKWNGGFAPYGYKLENGELVIAEDEVEIIQMIFDQYIHTNDGINGVANYLNNHGYTKKLRQNGTIPGFSSSFIKKIIDNPVYMGKIAYGRRRTEKKTGTRNETHVVEQSEFPVYEGIHEAIISEEDWNLAQEKRSKNNYRREKIHDPEHAHILSGILKCPCCGKGMYGNIAKAGRKDKKTRYYYYCKNTVNATGHKCTFRCNIEQSQIDDVLAKLITAMTREGKFKDVDNYIGLRTLVHLKNSPTGVNITLFSDNVGNNKLHNIEFTDFCKEYPSVKISMKKTGGIFHDRFIVLDYGISKYAPVIAALLKNPTLILPR